MANKIYNDEYIKDIANAIREKNNTQNTYLVSEMGDAIRAIEGSEGVPDVELIVVDSGVCGDTSYWQLYNNGTLYISGTGSTFDYLDDYIFYNRSDILNVVIEEGITIIGERLFNKCVGMKTISLPDTLQYIETAAFLCCTNLSNFIFPQNVSSIEPGTFSGCTNLKSVVICGGIRSIDIDAFDECESLSDVYYCGTKEQWDEISINEGNDCLLNANVCYEYEIPSRPPYVEGAKLQEKTITENGEYIADDGYDGFSKVIVQVNSVAEDDFSNLVLVDSGVCGESAYWELYDNGTLYINGSGATFDYGNSAGYGRGLSPFVQRSDINCVVFGSEITHIGDFFLFNNSTISEITIYKGLISTGDAAFCGLTALEHLVFPDSTVTIGDRTFEYCLKLKYVVIPKSVQNIGDSIFMDSTELDYIYYKGTKNEWDNININSTNEDELANIQICYNYKESSTQPIYKPEQEKSVTITESGTTEVLPDDGYTMSKITINVDIPTESAPEDNLTLVDSGVCGDNVTWKLYDDGILRIQGVGATYNYTAPGDEYENISPFSDLYESIKNIIIEDGITHIGNWLFFYMNSVDSIVIPDGVYTIGEGAFYQCEELSTVHIPRSVIEIKTEAFNNCDNLQNVIYSGSRYEWVDISIGSYNTSLSNATIHFAVNDVLLQEKTFIENGEYEADEGYDGFSKVIVNVDVDVGGINIANEIIDGSVSDLSPFANVSLIKSYTFYDCKNITSASFPNCSKIGAYAFYQCYNMSTVNFPTCKFMGAAVFIRCSELGSANFPECSNVGASAFYSCDNLTSANFPKCTTIGSSAFYTCKNLNTISFPACSFVGQFAFSGCSNLKSANLPNVSSFAQSAFCNCNKLSIVTCSAKNIGSYAFAGCSNLLSFINTCSSVATLVSNTFSNTPMLNSAYTGTYGSIYVPASLVNAYKADTNWNLLSSRITSIIT